MAAYDSYILSGERSLWREVDVLGSERPPQAISVVWPPTIAILPVGWDYFLKFETLHLFNPF